VKGYGPLDSLGSPRRAGVATFLGLPQVTGLEGVDVACVGLPFDAAVGFRVGARFGPAALREASRALRSGYSPVQRVAVFDRLSAVDAGDAPVVPGKVERSLALMEEMLTQVHEAGAVPLGFGGDHSVLLAELRAAAQRHGQLGLVSFDAHYDTWTEESDERSTHGAVLRRAVAEGLIDPKRSSLLGMRGAVSSAADVDAVRELGFLVVPWHDLAQLGTGMVEAAVERAGGKAFLTFDVDFVDPAFAPGTGTPAVGGPSSAQALALLQGARGLEIVGADVVEVLPSFDQSQLTALLGVTAAYEILTLIAAGRPVAG